MAEELQTIPQDDIDLLLTDPNPTRISQFDEVYGPGRGAQVVRESAPGYGADLSDAEGSLC